MKLYLGGPLFTPHQREVGSKIATKLRSSGFEVFVPAEDSAKVWRGRAPKDCTEEERDQVFRSNYENVITSDILIAWVGGMDEMVHAANDQLARAARHLVDEHPNTIPPYHLTELRSCISMAENRKAAPSDTGIAWEMGVAWGWNKSIEDRVLSADDVSDVTHVLAYIDESDERQSMNLMLNQGVHAVAYGVDQLMSQVQYYHLHGLFTSSSNLPSEEVPIVDA